MNAYVSKTLNRIDLTTAIAKTIAVLLSYLVGFYTTGNFHGESQYFGAMLAAIGSVVALQADIKTSLKQGWLRILGTFIGAMIATLYLLVFPFSVAGFVVTIFILEVACMLLRIPDNGKMATIALIVIMLISEKNPNISPIVNSSLRFLETVVGVTIGIGMAWVVDFVKRKRQKRTDKGDFVRTP